MQNSLVPHCNFAWEAVTTYSQQPARNACWACEETFCVCASVLLARQRGLSPLTEAMPCVMCAGKQMLWKIVPCMPLEILKASFLHEEYDYS